MELLLFGGLALVQAVEHLVNGHWCVHRAHVDHGVALLAVQVLHARQRLRAVELEDELKVVEDEHLLGAFLAAESDSLPHLALVLAQVENLEGFAALDVQQPLAGGVDGKAPQVAADPAPPHLLGHGQRGARSAEEVGDEIAFV